MSQPEIELPQQALINWLRWFEPEFRAKVVSRVQSRFPNFPLPRDIQAVIDGTQQILALVEEPQAEPIKASHLVERLKGNPSLLQLFQQIVLRYRRCIAARTEGFREQTFHPELIDTVEQEVTLLDDLTARDWFQGIEAVRLPKAKDFLPVRFIEELAGQLGEYDSGQKGAPERQFDEKFHMLQAPALFLPDLASLRARCELRDTPLTVAFVDIDDFKQFNEKHSETTVDRNLLPRFMQTLEAHVYHHGYAYRQGGDEYLVLLPSLSRELAIAFLDELRCKLGQLEYPQIEGKTTVSIGLCLAEPDCPLTDRELRDRANQAKKFAKKQGKNCIATYEGPRFIDQELRVVRPEERTDHG